MPPQPGSAQWRRLYRRKQTQPPPLNVPTHSPPYSVPRQLGSKQYRRWYRKAQVQPPNAGGQGYGGILMQPFQANFQASQFAPFPNFILALKIEILLNGTWTDISSFVYQRDPIVITRSRPNESQQVNPQQCTMTINNKDGRFSVSNTLGAYYPYLTRNVQLRVSIVNVASSTGVTYSGYRFWGEVSNWPPQWDPTGSDVYVQLTASGVLRRYAQGAKIGSPLRRYYTSLAGTNFAPIAVWPAEDQTGATEIASMIPAVSAMTFTGSPSFGADNSFGGSDAIPAFASSAWHGATGSAANPPGTGSITESTPGTYTWRCPPGVSTVNITELVGSGGGGGWPGTGPTGPGLAGGGGGGGGGEQTQNSSVAVTANNVYTYFVAAGGAPAAGVGQAGGNGSFSYFQGDSHQAIAIGGQGGQPGTSNSGGGAGFGGSGSGEPVSNPGGQGAGGSSATTATYNQFLQGSSGPNAKGYASGGQVTQNWVSPITGTVSVTAQGAGGGGAGGGYFGFGGGGGGGGGYSSGNIDVTQGQSYTFYAGNGGPGGVGNNNISNCSGGPGGDSTVQGDSLSIDGHAGGGGGASTNNHNVGGQGGAGNIHNGATGGVSDQTNNTGGGAGGGDSGQNFPTGHGLNAVGRTPGASVGAGAGGGWGATTQGGSGATPGGQAGQYGGGGGGGGSIDGTHGRYGGGGGPGYISWTYTVPAAPAGGGGGSSGGTFAAGNPGSVSGTGGSAPAGGGAGGSAGTVSPNGSGPGGGGAGGIPDTGQGVVPPGSGGPGAITFSWNGGTTSPVAANIVRFLLHMDSAGSVDGAVVARIVTYGTIQTIDVIYHTTSGGQLEVKGYTGGTQYFDQTGCFSNLNGQDVCVSVSLTGTGGTNAAWQIQAIVPGAGSVLNTYGASLSGITIANVSDVYGNPNGTITDNATSAGWFVIQTYADTLVNISPVLAGYAGETVAARLQRLCTEEGITFTLHGNASDTPQMGPQADDTLLNVFQFCEDMDLGLLFEPRDSLGLAYRTRVSMQGQNPALSLDYEQVNRPGWSIASTNSGEPVNLIVIPTSQVYLLNIGQFFQLENSSGVLKEPTIFTILSIGGDFFGFTNVTFSPVAQTSINVGDLMVQVSSFGQQLVLPLQPVPDDQFIRNDITLTRVNGSSVVVAQTTGIMSVNTPPNGVGDYTYSKSVYAYSDSQLANMASWLLSIGTVPEERYPVINIDMSRSAMVALYNSVGNMDVGDFIEIDNPPIWLTQTSIKQLAYGFTETLNAYQWTIGINAVPESPYSIGNPPTW